MASYLLVFSVSFIPWPILKILVPLDRAYFVLFSSKGSNQKKSQISKTRIQQRLKRERKGCYLNSLCGKNILTWRHSVIDVMVTSPFDSLLWLANRIPNIIYAWILHQLERRYHNLHILYQLKSFAANFPWLRLAFLFLYWKEKETHILNFLMSDFYWEHYFS